MACAPRQPPDQLVDAPGVGQQSAPRLGQPQLRMLGRHHQIASQDQFQPAAHCIAIDHGQQRLIAVAAPLKTSRGSTGLGAVVTARGLTCFSPPLQIGTSAERPCAAAGQKLRPRHCHRRGSAPKRRLVPSAMGGWMALRTSGAVEGDRGDVVALFVADELVVGHCSRRYFD